MKIGITGNTGFIGTHLTDYLKTKTDIEIVPFEKEFFLYQEKLHEFIKQSDVIIHLAGRSKPHNKDTVYNDNMLLTRLLLNGLGWCNFKGHLIFTSSIHENETSYYAMSKKEGRELLSHRAKFTGLILPNVFGPGAKGENSFITAFCKQLYTGWEPKIFKDVEVGLIYIDELIRVFYDVITIMEPTPRNEVLPTSNHKISYILTLLKLFNSGNDYMTGSFARNLNTTWKRNLAAWQS